MDRAQTGRGDPPPSDSIPSAVPPYRFTAGFQRKILALAIRGDLLRVAPEVFHSRFFGSLSNGGPKPPRQRLAELVEQHVQQYPGGPPGIDTIDELLTRLLPTFSAEERPFIEDEWRLVRGQDISDPRYVMAEACRWAQSVAVSRALLQAAEWVEAVQQGATMDLGRLRGTMDQALQIGEPKIGKGGEYFATLFERLAWWRQNPYEGKLPSGFPSLDRFLQGGPRYAEAFYILAPPKGAKTAFLMNVALNAVRKRRGVAFFSFEMGLRPMLMRMDRNVACRLREELHVSTEPLEHAVRGLRAAGAGRVWVQQFQARKQGCEEAIQVVERLRAEGLPVDLVVLDYLNIMSTEKHEREKRHELAQISRDMSALAKELDVVVWSAALTNRKAVDKDRVTKVDIAEAFEVVSVLDGAVAWCGGPELRKEGKQRLYLVAAREEEDETEVGTYKIDRGRMLISEVPPEGHKTEEGSDGGNSRGVAP